MMTRSKTLQMCNSVQEQYTVDIDFDTASNAWLANKIPLGCGTYKYKKNTDYVKPKNTNGVTHNYNLRSKKYHFCST